jgi:hypothetical protein
MIRADDLRVGDLLQSCDPRDDGRLVRVEAIDGDRIEVRRGRYGSGRRSTLRAPLRRWEFATERDDR